MDFSALRVIVIDECDFFFGDQKNFELIKAFAKHRSVDSTKVQYLLFSATHGAGIGAEAKTAEV